MSRVYKVGEVSDILENVLSNTYDLKSIYIRRDIKYYISKIRASIFFFKR